MPSTLVRGTPAARLRRPVRDPWAKGAFRLAVLCVFALLVAALPVARCAWAEELLGRVVGVGDGGGVRLLTDARAQLRLRMAEIDAPERRQPYGARSRRELAALAFGREVRAVVVGFDRRWHRPVVRVYADGLDVNAEMVRRGAAWVYRAYSRDPSFPALEREAREARRGLWALSEPERVPPWEWRRRRHDAP